MACIAVLPWGIAIAPPSHRRLSAPTWRFAMRVILLGCLVAAILVQTPAGAATAQDVRGVVLDSSGAVMPGATVTLITAGAAPRSTVTDAQGRFTFANVPVGRATLNVELAGFTRVTREIRIGDGVPVSVRIPLSVGRLQETVAVAERAQAAFPGSIAGGVAGGIVAGVGASYRIQSQPGNTAAYDRIDDNGFRRVSDHPLSTFSSDVDTASYSNVRRFLTSGTLPPPDAVRVEELINYFRFDYAPPLANVPVSVTTELAACPWNAAHRLALVGLQTRTLDAETTPPRNLVFLLDVSGSMAPPDRLPLVRTALRMFTDTLNARDRIAIVVYAGASGLVLPATPGNLRERIHEAIAGLEAGGSTNGASGIQLAYNVAANNYIKGGINRVILATDGDFNVGVTSQGDLIRLIEKERERGIFLSVLGVGRDNLKDSTMQKLADSGNGNYAYLDSLHEARRVLIAQAGATLVTVAKDVKIQVEFNPAAVAAYRLIGYEKRLLQNEDFNDDKKDAGEIGAGHSVTVLYEIVPAGTPVNIPSVDALKYQPAPEPARANRDELMTVKVRYKDPEGGDSRLMATPVRNRTADVSGRLGFAASVAEFGMLLRDSEHKGSASWRQTAELARRHRGDDADGYRAEFVRLIELAGSLAAQNASARNER
jgi:Ca-activated chloride channel homolog